MVVYVFWLEAINVGGTSADIDMGQHAKENEHQSNIVRVIYVVLLGGLHVINSLFSYEQKTLFNHRKWMD